MTQSSSASTRWRKVFREERTPETVGSAASVAPVSSSTPAGLAGTMLQPICHWMPSLTRCRRRPRRPGR
eukprot:10208819-Lingulodinium_polyedra.AAC.1